MLSARDQENLVHTHQTAGAGKALNQGLRHLPPKTPGNKVLKTPFKVPLNDENNPLALKGQKTGLNNVAKGNENFVNTGKQDGKLDKNAFVTPMGPKTRAPLGMKTTNAKANAFQTPAPPLGTIKANQPSTSRKSKIQVAQTEPVDNDLLSREEDDDVPDIEYMPPKPIPLPDPPEDIEYDDTYPQFKGANFYRGWREIYREEVGEDGMTESQRKFKEMGDKALRDFDKKFLRETEEELRAERPKKPAATNSTVKHPSTIKARRAANALSKPKPAHGVAKPTAASTAKSKLPSSLAVPKKKPLKVVSTPTHHAAALADSNTTLGYSKGRNVSKELRPSVIRKNPPPASQSQEDCDLQANFENLGILDDLFMPPDEEYNESVLLFNDDEEADNFQLPMPE